jgi:hypothetical protein
MVCGKEARNRSFPTWLTQACRARNEMMDPKSAAAWMLSELEMRGCIYQDDVVDYLVKTKNEELLRENSDGNLVVGRSLLEAFRTLTETNVVWVKPDRYWRFRVMEDEPGRDARG